MLKGPPDEAVLSMAWQDQRQQLVRASLFYTRLACWAKHQGFHRVIHGHTHKPKFEVLHHMGVEFISLPTWREGESLQGPGAVLLKDGRVELVLADAA